jgi:hypothetical protein
MALVLRILVVAVVFAGLASAAASAAKAKVRSCPTVAWQRAADGAFWIHPVTYKAGAHRVGVRFRYTTPAGRSVSMVKYYRLDRRGRIALRAVRPRPRGSGIVRSTETCVPPRGSVRPRRPRRYPKGTRLPVRRAWALPGNRVAPAARRPPAPVTAPPVGGSPIDPTPPPAPAPVPNVTLLTAGDIANCFNNVPNDPNSGQHPGAGAIETTALVQSLLPVDDLIVQGDLAYESGTAAEFRDCYDPTWGQFRSFTHPAPGNHEYVSPGAAPYYAYWGDRAGPAGRGYYSYELGNWHIVSLNSEVDTSGAGQQAAWLRADLAAHPNLCTLAFWHRPRWSNDASYGDDPSVAPMFQILYDAGVDVLLQGHAHAYERWSEMAPDGTTRPGRGVRAFVVGTGGAESHAVNALEPGEEVSQGNVFGVMRMTLTASGYSWEFLPTVSATFTDSGATACH